MIERVRRWAWLAFAVFGIAGCAINPVTGGADFVLMTEAQERELGARYHIQILTRYGRYPDARLQALVEKVGQRLVRVSHRPSLDYRFTLLDSPEVNAFALPGGYIYITRGLLAYLASEDELAAVLGHELGHVTARHSVRQHSTATVTGLLGAVIGSQTGLGGQELANLAGTALVRGYGRDHELEADRLGAAYLAAAGYEPDALLEVIRVLKNQELHEQIQAREEGREARVYHGLFATHPDNDRRLQEVVAAAKPLRSGGVMTGADGDFMQALDGLVIGDSEDQGIVRDHRYYHGELGIMLSLPRKWRVLNGRDRLIVVSPGRDAVMQLETLDADPARAPEQLLRDALGDATPMHEFAIEGPGRKGRGASVRLDTPFGVRDARIAIVVVGKRVFRISAAVDPAPWPAGYEQAIRETLFSLKPLDPGDRKLAGAYRLRVIRLEQALKFSDLARKYKELSSLEDQLRLLNRLYPAGEPQAGRWFKLIR